LQTLPFNSYIFKGSKDAVVSEKNFGRLQTEMNQEKLKVFELDDYAHLDYVWGVEAHLDIYSPILEILEQEK
jgi:lysosomal acid lipase/cholesteryl ester hydrolase